MNLLKAPDYSTPNKKKRFVESECRRMLETVESVNSDVESYLGGVYGTRRQKAILNYLDRAEDGFKSFGLTSIVEAFTKNELMPFSNYNHLDDDCDLRIGAALWILDKLRAEGRMLEAYEILPDESGDMDVWYLPVDFYHPCYANDLIQSVIHAITTRYTGRGQRGIVITKENAIGKKAGETYSRLLALMPQESVEKACNEFRSKVWELASRYMKGQAYYDREIQRTVRQIQNNKLAVPRSGPLVGPFFAPTMASLAEPFSAPLADPMIGGIPGFGGGNESSTMEIAIKGQEMIEQEHRYSMDFDSYLKMDRKEIRKMTGSREVADAVAGFTVSDPYELCFALFYLMDTGDDAPWLMRSGSSLMLYSLRMLPWYVEQDDGDDDDDDDWDSWYGGLQYNQNGWLDREPVPDQIDYYHDKHNGRNLAQVIYDLSRGVVPTGLHPFDAERGRLVSEGMDGETARKITDTAELLFLIKFQAKQSVLSDLDFPWLDDEEQDESKPKKQDESKPETAAVNTSADKAATTPTGLGGYWGKVMGQSPPDDQGASEIQDIAGDRGEENEKLKAELNAAKKQLKNLKNALAAARQESNNERAKYEHELKALRLEHRELADLRELVFNSGMAADEQARRERATEQISYPYACRKRTVVFGGHETWLKAIRPMLPDVKFVDVGNYAFNPELVRNADVVWVQHNCISHSQYGNIVKLTRQYGIQLRYFGYAGAEKCAEQLVVEDRKG